MSAPMRVTHGALTERTELLRKFVSGASVMREGTGMRVTFVLP